MKRFQWKWIFTVQKDPLFGVNLTFFAPFWIFFNPSKAATHYSGYSYKASWSLMKGIQKFLNPPFFVSMATVA
jgi:hypothetical protein